MKDKSIYILAMAAAVGLGWPISWRAGRNYEAAAVDAELAPLVAIARRAQATPTPAPRTPRVRTKAQPTPLEVFIYPKNYVQ